MFRKVFILSVTVFFFSCLKMTAQKVTFDPVDWQPDESVTLRVDFNGTSFAGFPGDIYLWSWVKNGAGDNINAPANGTWENADNLSKLTGSGNVRTFTFTPTSHFGLSKEFLSISGINVLFKDKTGSNKTQDFVGIRPIPDDGILKNTTWAAAKKIKLLVDVSETPLAGTSDNLYYWGWYRVGDIQTNSPQNGAWENSDAASQMTRIGTSDTYFIEFTPTTYFATSAANLTPTSVFGLVKKLNGTNGKTDDFGLESVIVPPKTVHKKYLIHQINATNVLLSPQKPGLDIPVTITFTAEGSLKNTSASVFMHTGVVTESLSSTAWNHTQGIWGDSLTSKGKMTRSGSNPNIYTLSIPSIREYYGLTINENAFKIMAVFRNANGSVIEKDGGSDIQLLITPDDYLVIREPMGTFLTKPIGQPFRITGYTGQIADFTIKVNGITQHTATAVQRATVMYTPVSAGNYAIEITAVSGAKTFVKTTSVTVCATTSIASAITLPAGLKYGINYNVADATKATLVLHAPTESIQSVHVIGDFNNWQLDCNYLLNWDPAKKVFWKELSGLVSGKEYVFQYLIDGKTRIGDPYTEKVSDPWNDADIPEATYPQLIQYPTAARPQSGETPTIASVLQTNQPNYVWENTAFKRPEQSKLNIYQLHFRDFTMEGTFLAAIEKLDYLKRMGINAIETLPVSEFEGNDSWGYNPNYYFAVDKAYGTKDQYKKFVDECHKRGIAVIGDIVLNHAFGTNPHARMYWDDLNNRPAANNPWFNPVKNFLNEGIADWGMDFNHDSPHTQRMVDSVANYWLKEYKIDGIRFDFTKGFSNTPYPNASCGDEWGGCYDNARVANLTRMADKMWGVSNGATGSFPYVIFEHLAQSAEDKYLTEYGNNILLWSGVVPNHKYGEVAMGWAPTAGEPNKSDLNVAYYKSKTFANPTWISYMESHDEERLAFLQKAYGNGTIKTDSLVQAKFLQTAAVMNLLFPGPRQIWQFGELGYDYSINFNGRTGRKPIRWDYFDYPQRKKIYETYAKLLWLRNAMPKTFHRDFDNGVGGGSITDLVSQFKRYHFYSAVGDTAVTIIANTGNSTITGSPNFNGSTSVQWYEFLSQTWQTVGASITLQPGESRIYMNKAPAIATPAFGLTSPVSTAVGIAASHIEVQFSEGMAKTVLPNFLGKAFDSNAIQRAFTLKDAANVNVPISGVVSLDKKKLTVQPLNALPVGNYQLTLLKDSVQNFGGIRYAADFTYNFSIQAGNPCLTNKNFIAGTDDFSTGIINQKTTQQITANNTISGTAKVTYDAKSYVLLSPGFEVSVILGAVFTAKTGGCIE